MQQPAATVPLEPPAQSAGQTPARAPRHGLLRAPMRAPLRARVPLHLGPHAVGSLDPLWLQRVAEVGIQPVWDLKKTEQTFVDIKAEEPFFSEKLVAFGVALRVHNLCGPWRNEGVPVLRDDGTPWATLERGLVRVLGLRTQAVHLVGLVPEGHCWVQQRSLTKPNDPGLWDTLMGGTVSGDETLADTLARETWEEAGLDIHALNGVRHAGRFTAGRPTPDGGGAGYLLEDTHWYVGTVPKGTTPVNQDGEVDHFECWSPQQVHAAIAAGRFTPEAAWVLAQVLQ